MALPTPTSTLNAPSHSALHSAYIDASMFDAVGDGSTDATGALQGAFDAAIADEVYEVRLPAGTYRLASTLTLPFHAMTIRGAGRDRTILKPDAGVSAFTITSGKHNVVFEEFSVNGTDTTSKGFVCGTASGSNDFIGTWHRIDFNTLGYAIDTNGGGHELTGNRFLQCGFVNAPLRFNATVAHNLTSFLWCRFVSMAQNKPAVEYTGFSEDVSNSFVACDFESNDRQAIKITRNRQMVLRGCYFESNNMDAVAGLPWVDLCSGTYEVALYDCYMVSNSAVVGVGSSDSTTHTAVFENLFLSGSTPPTVDRTALISYVESGQGAGGPDGLSEFSVKGQYRGAYFTTSNALYPLARFVLGATGTPVTEAVQFVGQDGTTILASVTGTGGFRVNKVSSARDQLLITDTTAGAGLTIGSDTNLYRSAANVLKTDDSFVAIGTVTSGAISASGVGAPALTATVDGASTSALTATGTTGSRQWSLIPNGTGSSTGTAGDLTLYDGSGGVPILELANSTNIADTQTALLVRRNVAGSLSVQRVSMGAADSGGAGYKVLRVPN